MFFDPFPEEENFGLPSSRIVYPSSYSTRHMDCDNTFLIDPQLERKEKKKLNLTISGVNSRQQVAAA